MEGLGGSGVVDCHSGWGRKSEEWAPGWRYGRATSPGSPTRWRETWTPLLRGRTHLPRMSAVSLQDWGARVPFSGEVVDSVRQDLRVVLG